MELIEPKEIELTSNICKGKDGSPITKKFRLGMYPSLYGIGMVADTVAVLDMMARKKTIENHADFRHMSIELAREACKYIQVQLSNGNWATLDSEAMINAHVPDREMLGLLVLKSHDHSSFFLHSGRVSSIFQRSMAQAKAQASKICTQLLDSLSQKARPRSKK